MLLAIMDNCRQLSLPRARASISSVTFSNSLIEMRPVADQVLNNPDHTGRQYVGTCSQEVWKLMSQEAKSSPHRNAAFKKETADLVDHSCTIADEAGSNAMERL